MTLMNLKVDKESYSACKYVRGDNHRQIKRDKKDKHYVIQFPGLVAWTLISVN